MGCVYLARNRVNEKRYVGKTIYSLAIRSSNHAAIAKQGKSRMYIAKAIAKYGPEQFEWTVLLESENNEELCKVERVMIAMLKTKVPKGYNLTDGGEGSVGFHHSEAALAKLRKPKSAETRAKLSAAAIGRKRGPFSAKTRAKMRAVAKRRKFSAETRAKISAAAKVRKFSAETRAKMGATRKGRKHSDETKAKIAAAHKGLPCSAEAKAKISATKRAKKRKARQNDLLLAGFN